MKTHNGGNTIFFFSSDFIVRICISVICLSSVLSLSSYAQSDIEIVRNELDSLIAFNKSNMFGANIQQLIQNNAEILELSEFLPAGQRKLYKVAGLNLQGVVYKRLNELDKAYDFFQEIFKYTVDSLDNTFKYQAYNNMAIIHTMRGDSLKKSIEKYEKALSELNEDDLLKRHRTYVNMAWSYSKRFHFDESKKYLDQAQEYLQKEGGGQEKTYLNYLYGKFYFAHKDYEKSLLHFGKARMYGERYDIEIMDDVYHDYSQLLNAMGSHKEAFDVLEKYVELKEGIFTKTQIFQNEMAKAKFEVSYFQREKKNADLQVKKSKALFIVSFLFSVVLIVFSVSFFWLNRKKKRLTDQLEKQNSELQLANAKYLKASEQKSKFISTVSHELRTPLYGVIGITSLLLKNKEFSKQNEEYLKSLKFSGDYLLNLINDILLMSKIEVNKIEPILENFNLRDLSVNVLHSFKHQSIETKNSLHLEVEPSIPKVVRGDRLRLSQILINLLGNALKFTNGGDVWLRIKLGFKADQGIRVIFEVEDTGIGIPDDKQEEIFESFSQIDNRESAFKGTGLGLPIIKKLIRFYGGKIKVTSELGKGSLFWFDLIFSIPNDIDETSENNLVSLSDVSNKKVLIVEDNKVNQLVTRKILENANFTCDVADNGKIGMQMAGVNEYDLILMDLHMPVMDGIESTKKIRSFDPIIPIILLTASEITKNDNSVKDIGINEVLVKPYSTQQFFEIIIRSIRDNKNLHTTNSSTENI